MSFVLSLIANQYRLQSKESIFLPSPFSDEINALNTEISRHQDDLLWRIELESAASSVVSRFTELESFVYSLRLIRRGLFKSIATSAEHFVNLRYRLISSHASLSALYFILGKFCLKFT